MKFSIKNTAFSAVIITSILAFNACKKTDDTPPTSKGAVAFHMHTVIDTAEVDAGQVAKDATGRRFELDVAQFYVSGIVLHKADGTSYPLTNDYVLKVIGEEEYLIDSVPAGNYSYVSFNVGVDAANNAKDPSTFASSSVLSPQNPSMWFGNTSQGYIFMNIQGKADTTTAQNGAANFPFSYQVGTNALLQTVTMSAKTFTVVAGQEQFIHLNADYGKALKGINFKTNPTATPTTNLSIVTQIAGNIPGMFSYEE